MEIIGFNHSELKKIPRYTCGIYSIHNILTEDCKKEGGWSVWN